jgi:dTDP-4-amino-4,6-dideoxygalactose transaminase
VKRLRNYGQRVRYYHDEEGRNSRLDEMQAAILRVKLAELHRWNDQRRKIAAIYDEELRGSSASRPELIDGSVSSRHLFPILVDAARRDRIREELTAAGVDTQIHYPVPLHKQKAYSALFDGLTLPHAEEAAGRLISLPMYPQLTEDEARHVAAAVKKIVG